jgi:hypothetical protein
VVYADTAWWDQSWETPGEPAGPWKGDVKGQVEFASRTDGEGAITNELTLARVELDLCLPSILALRRLSSLFSSLRSAGVK